MKNLKFSRIILLSDSQKSANLFEFAPGYNLITGKDNSIGKTTLIKCLLWGLGCDPTFDDKWKKFDLKTLVTFTIGQDEFTFYRYQKTISVSSNGSAFVKYPKITGEYADYFASLVGFDVLLPNKPAKDEEPELTTPPPAYYFTPFYIDQRKGWVEPWNNFENLGQFAKWKPTVIKFHTGYLIPKHFVLEEDVYNFRHLEVLAENELKRIDTALSVVDSYIPPTTFSVTPEELDVIAYEVGEKLEELSKRQESILSELSVLTPLLHQNETQLDMVAVAIGEKRADYEFAVENIQGDFIECPICGTQHHNSMVQRAGLLADHSTLENEADNLLIDTMELRNTIHHQQDNLRNVSEEISLINRKYIPRVEILDSPKASIIESLASRSVRKNVGEAQDKRKLESKDASDKQKKIKKLQNKLLTKIEKTDRNDEFLTSLIKYVEALGSQGITLEKIKTPKDYKRLFDNGGAAEGTRGGLAYYQAVLDMIIKYGSEVIAPFIIDTPRQQEQANLNYKNIIQSIITNTHKEQQVFLCALDNAILDTFKVTAKIIELNQTEMLMSGKQYSVLSKQLNEIYS